MGTWFHVMTLTTLTITVEIISPESVLFIADSDGHHCSVKAGDLRGLFQDKWLNDNVIWMKTCKLQFLMRL